MIVLNVYDTAPELLDEINYPKCKISKCEICDIQYGLEFLESEEPKKETDKKKGNKDSKKKKKNNDAFGKEHNVLSNLFFIRMKMNRKKKDGLMVLIDGVVDKMIDSLQRKKEMLEMEEESYFIPCKACPLVVYRK
jgi:hypothetical protein